MPQVWANFCLNGQKGARWHLTRFLAKGGGGGWREKEKGEGKEKERKGKALRDSDDVRNKDERRAYCAQCQDFIRKKNVSKEAHA